MAFWRQHNRRLRLGILVIWIITLLGVTPPARACGNLCEQIGVRGQNLVAGQTIWRMNGVQFFLPQFGINGKTLWDFNYAAAIDEGSLDYWLDKAVWLRANTLRVFVDLPEVRSDGSIRTPTSYEAVYDLAERAAARGMRLGLVLHNSADWRMTSERSAWIGGLLSYFQQREVLPWIAYLSADNEINNHCRNSGRDCFDGTDQHDAQSYIDGAISWVAAFRAVAKAHAPQILVTVGISTEMIDFDGTRASFNFFRSATNGTRLVDLLDFLAPHNYSGGAAAVIADLRIGAGYTSAVVLEEYGFPTDPFPRNRLWSEGAFACRLRPLASECTNTAPFFVARSIQSVVSDGYAGSVAWTIADIREKNVSNACTRSDLPFDLWTGLFAIGGTYCDGGTFSRSAGQPKTTAILICVAYGGSLLSCDDPARPLYQTFLPGIERSL
jgi:hypothetical protein